MTASDAVNPGAKLQHVEFVGPQAGKKLATDGLLALLPVVIGIVIYLSIRFEWKLTMAGVIASLYDVVITLDSSASFQWEFLLSVLAGVLVVLDCSVSESVVIFDRIREALRRYRRMNTHEVIDHAIISTVSRTIITHGSTEMMVVSMLVFGGPTLHYFAVVLTISILFDIYSSVFVAVTLYTWFGVKCEDPAKAEKKAGGLKEDDPNLGVQV